MKYMVCGAGGIGGCLASILLERFGDEVTLIARKKRKTALESQGLILHGVALGEKITHCQHIIEIPAQAGLQDMIFICVKNYSLVEAVQSLIPCVDDHAIVVLVLNGIDHAQVTQAVLQKGKIVDSLIFMGAHFNDDYSYTQNTAFARLTISSPWPEVNEAIIAALGGKDGLEVSVSEDMKSSLWQKYVHNCGFNTITAYYQCDAGGLLEQPTAGEELRALLQEAVAVGKADGATFPEGFAEKAWDSYMKRADKDAISSMATDVINGRPTEIETFGGHLTRLAQKLGVPAPVSQRFYDEMKARGL